MRKAIVLAGVLLAASCGSDGFDPSGPGGTPINQLTDEQAKTLCTEAVTFESSTFSTATQIEYACRRAGHNVLALAGSDPTDAELQTICKVGYDACKRDPPVIPPDPPVAQTCANSSTQGSGCVATVDQYAACINERLALLERVVPPCNQITKAKVLEIALAQEGPACKTFIPLCPELATSELMMSSALKLEKR